MTVVDFKISEIHKITIVLSPRYSDVFKTPSISISNPLLFSLPLWLDYMTNVLESSGDLF